MGEWGFLGALFDNLQAHSPMLGRFWLLLMLVFRILILGTVASDLFDDEQEEFACNTLQPGCKQVCYDTAFPISQYRFWVFHIVLIATPSMLFIMYAMHHHSKASGGQGAREGRRFRSLYLVNVAFRLGAELGFLIGQWWLYGFRVQAQFPCSRFPCPYTVDCFTSRPAEKTVFLCFYFGVGVVSAACSCVEFFYGSVKWFCCRPGAPPAPEHSVECQNGFYLEEAKKKLMSESVRLKRGRAGAGSGRRGSGGRQKPRGGRYLSSRTFMV